MRPRNKIASLLLFSLILCGCSSTTVTHHAPFSKLHPEQTDLITAPYRIGAGDEIEVKFFSAPELNDRMFVRPDGKISLMFASNIRAAGRTPEELESLLRRKLSAHIRNPDMVIIMRGFASQKVFVGGEVLKPGPVILTTRETVSQILDEAGWILPSARRDEVVLLRRADDGLKELYLINVEQIMTGDDITQDIMVLPGDVILVPPSGPVEFDRWMDQHVREALPIPGAAVINRGVGPQ